MKKTLFLSVLFLCGLFSVQAQITPSNNTLYVNTSVASGNGSGGSWVNAIPELADALKYARQQEDAGNGWTTADPLQIFVAVGTYKPLYDAGDGLYTTDGGRNNAFIMVNNIQVYGGFDPANNITDLNDARILPNSGVPISGLTHLSGDIGVANDNTDNSYHVVLFSGAVGSALLSGVAITGGMADTGVTITVNGATIFGEYGAGLSNYSGAAPTLTNLLITKNTAKYAGGFYCRDADPTVTNVTITENTATVGGGGMYIWNSAPSFTNVSVVGNNAQYQGGGIYNWSSEPRFTNATISGNTATDAGGGIYNNTQSTLVLNNTIIWGNTAAQQNEIFNGNGSSITLDHCLYANATGDVGGTGTVTPTNSIHTDPLFTNAASGQYTLQSTSPAIDMGNNLLYLNTGGLVYDLDLAGGIRVYDFTVGTIDIGAYEFHGPPISFVYQNDTNGWIQPLGEPNVATTTTNNNIIVRSGSTGLSTDIDVKSVVVGAQATLNVEQVLTVSADIYNEGSLVFVSDGTKLGQLDEMPAGSTISGSGKITVERYIPARRAFRFLSSAITTTTSIHDNWQEGANSNTDNPHPGFGTHITGSTTDQQNGFDATPTGNHSLFSYNNSVQTWGYIPNTDVNTIEAGAAYRLMVRGGRNVDVTDNATAPTNTVLRTTGANADFVVGDFFSPSITLGQNAGDFNFIGNPYQSIVDMNDVLANSTNLNTNFYYVWDPTLGGAPTVGQPGGRGAYVTVALPAGTNSLGSQANQFLQPGQAAFVQTATAGFAKIVFGEADKAPFEIPTDVFRPSTSTAFINLQLYGKQNFLNGGTASDGLRINFTTGESNAVLLNDAAKLSNINENLAVVNGTSYLSIENRNLPVDNEVLTLFTSQYRHSNYTYKVNTSGFAGNITGYLKDAYLDTQTELMDGITTIDFSVDENIPESIASDRFSVVFAVNKLSVEEEEIQGFTIYPNPTNGNFSIKVPQLSGEKIQVSLYNILGQRVYEAEKSVGANQHVQVKIKSLETGIYLVKITNEGKTFTEKLIIQ